MTLTTPVVGHSEDRILLPTPKTTGGMPLCEALSARETSRDFDVRPIEPAVMSGLLWSASGCNRADGSRAAPSARNWRETDIFTATKHGLYLYDAQSHTLQLISSNDLRKATEMQEFVETAPLNLIYVADLARMDAKDRDEQRIYSAFDAGLIAQNVCLFCAAQSLATVIRGMVDRTALAKLLALRPDHRIIVAQFVGYPKN